MNSSFQTGIFPVAINLVSPVILGLCISELRRASKILLIENNGAYGMYLNKKKSPIILNTRSFTHALFLGKVPFMNPVELTAFKLWFSSIVVLPFALLFETQAVPETVYRGGLPEVVLRPSVYDALLEQR